MFILAAEYLLGCVSVTNGVVHVPGSDQDERALPLVTKALCDIYGITYNPNFKERAAACLRQLAIDTRALLASELMIGGGGMRNLPIIEESSDNAQPTNEDESVSVEI